MYNFSETSDSITAGTHYPFERAAQTASCSKRIIDNIAFYVRSFTLLTQHQKLMSTAEVSRRINCLINQSYLGRFEDRSWRRRPGRPRNRPASRRQQLLACWPLETSLVTWTFGGDATVLADYALTTTTTTSLIQLVKTNMAETVQHCAKVQTASVRFSSDWLHRIQTLCYSTSVTMFSGNFSLHVMRLSKKPVSHFSARYEGRSKSFATRYIRLKNFSNSIHQQKRTFLPYSHELSSCKTFWSPLVSAIVLHKYCSNRSNSFVRASHCLDVETN